MRWKRSIVLVWLALTPAAVTWATEYAIDPHESILGVVVHKGGVAARFAHNHLIYPSEYTATLSAENGDAKTARFELSFPVKDLKVDEDDAHNKWYPLIEKNGILDEPFSALKEDDRKVVAEHMLGEDQLDAATYPEISAKLLGVRDEAKTQGKQAYAQAAKIAFTVHGKTVERECAANIVTSGDSLSVDAVGVFKFSEFGFKPYSAMLGAVKNLDEFHVFVHIQAAAKK